LESYTATGIPDLSGCYEGNEAWFELKVLTTRNDKSYPTFRPLQIAWQTLRTQHGGRVYNLVHHPSSQMLLIIDGKNLGARLMDGDVSYDAKRPINMDQKAWQVLFSQMFSGQDGWMD
jgi:penicillin-binding protein-related factor A (putative recombinase)